MIKNLKISEFVVYLISIMLTTLALFIPRRQDYVYYIEHWRIIREGNDPYINTDNAYGIVYNYFAYIDFSEIISLPRALFVIAYLIASFIIYKSSKKLKLPSSSRWILLFVLFLNPLLLFYCLKYGSNDLFLSGLVIMAFYLLEKKYLIWAGITFGLSIGFKFTPVFIVPFFFLVKNKLNWRFITSLGVSVVLIFLIGYLHWGETIFEPFKFGSARESKVFSFFRFIRGSLSPFQVNLDGYSTYLVLLSALSCFFFYVKYKLDKYLMALLTFSCVLLFYKVGHPQFYILLLLLTVFTFVMNHDLIIKSKALLISTILFWSWIFFFTILYDYTYGFSEKVHIIRDFLGLPTAIIHILFNYQLIQFIRKKRRIKISQD